MCVPLSVVYNKERKAVQIYYIALYEMVDPAQKSTGKRHHHLVDCSGSERSTASWHCVNV